MQCNALPSLHHISNIFTYNVLSLHCIPTVHSSSLLPGYRENRSVYWHKKLYLVAFGLLANSSPMKSHTCCNMTPLRWIRLLFLAEISDCSPNYSKILKSRVEMGRMPVKESEKADNDDFQCLTPNKFYPKVYTSLLTSLLLKLFQQK